LLFRFPFALEFDFAKVFWSGVLLFYQVAEQQIGINIFFVFSHGISSRIFHAFAPHKSKLSKLLQE
jgi:hypothetical protein